MRKKNTALGTFGKFSMCRPLNPRPTFCAMQEKVGVGVLKVTATTWNSVQHVSLYIKKVYLTSFQVILKKWMFWRFRERLYPGKWIRKCYSLFLLTKFRCRYKLGIDMEFVTSGTSGTCVKYVLGGVKFSRINAKNYINCKICQIQAWFFHKTR